MRNTLPPPPRLTPPHRLTPVPPAVPPPPTVPQPGVELYRDDRSGFRYCVPDSADIDAFRIAIEGLPGQESPEIFGLHPNADLTFRTLQVRAPLCVWWLTAVEGGRILGRLLLGSGFVSRPGEPL